MSSTVFCFWFIHIAIALRIANIPSPIDVTLYPSVRTIVIATNIVNQKVKQSLQLKGLYLKNFGNRYTSVNNHPIQLQNRKAIIINNISIIIILCFRYTYSLSVFCNFANHSHILSIWCSAFFIITILAAWHTIIWCMRKRTIFSINT